MCNRDYDFLDPRLEEFYEGLANMVNVRGWIHGLGAVTSQLTWAGSEVAVMERLFPALPGISGYKKSLRPITKKSNALLLKVVEDLSCVFSDGKENPWDHSEVEASREQFLKEFLETRNAFVLENQTTLMNALQETTVPLPAIHTTEGFAATA